MADDGSAPPVRVPQPRRVRVSRDGEKLVLEVRWFRLLHMALLAAAVLGSVFLQLFYQAPSFRTAAEQLPSWYPFVQIAAFVVAAYGGVAGLVNRTRVTVGGGVLEVKPGPLPWWGAKRVPTSDIAQVHCIESSAGSRAGGTTFAVVAITPQGRNLPLLGPVAERGVALFLEQEIETALGIPDRKVPGELPK